MFRKPLYAGALALGSALAAAPASATSTLNESPADKTWKAVWTGSPANMTWVRREPDGNISCFSTDGVHCNRDVNNPNEAKWKANTKPLVCGGQVMQAQWGMLGYNEDRESHWCIQGHAVLLEKSAWQDYTPLGKALLLAPTPIGDLMCFSEDGMNCSKVQNGKPVRDDGTDIDYSKVRPLVCGAHHRNRKGTSGYGPGEWCNLPRIIKRVTGQTIQPGRSLTVEIPYWTREEQPAVIVRSDLQSSGTLQVGLSAAYFNPSNYVYEPATTWSVGVDLGSIWGFLGSKDFRTPWNVPPSSYSPVFAISVTRDGKMCHFAGPVAANDLRSVFSPWLRRGDSDAVARWNGLSPFRIDSAPVPGDRTLVNRAKALGKPLTNEQKRLGDPYIEIKVPHYAELPFYTPPAVEVKELLFVTTPRVRHNNSATGDLRRVDYSNDCSQSGRYD